MTLRSESAFFLLVALASAVFVGIVRRIALMHGVIDHPTERGSHHVPTPRGGGLGAIASIVLAFGAILALTDRVQMAFTNSGIVAGALAACMAIAAIGWLDDRSGVRVGVRLGVHVVGGLCVGALALAMNAPVALSVVLFVWWVFWTVSSINLTNFMDGINGLVASQIAIFAGSLMLFAWQSSASTWYAAAVAAACIGFLPWNFPHARIFLGDVGSGSLGFLVPFLALLTMQETGVDIIRAHLPLFPLFADASITLVRRWRRREPLTQPHRNHLYQRLANGGMGHTRVTLLFAALALIGAIVAHLSAGIGALPLIAGYGVAVVLSGIALENRLAGKTQA